MGEVMLSMTFCSFHAVKEQTPFSLFHHPTTSQSAPNLPWLSFLYGLEAPLWLHHHPLGVWSLTYIWSIQRSCLYHIPSIQTSEYFCTKVCVEKWEGKKLCSAASLHIQYHIICSSPFLRSVIRSCDTPVRIEVTQCISYSSAQLCVGTTQLVINNQLCTTWRPVLSSTAPGSHENALAFSIHCTLQNIQILNS